jgi:signal transduction histidine kinase
LVENGKVHRDNPDFINDMFNTIEHVSLKMQRLVQQLRQPDQKLTESEVQLIEVIKDIFSIYDKHEVDLDFSNPDDLHPFLFCNRENLTSAIKHIVQNALESCGRKDRVIIEMLPESSTLVLLKVIDTGVGMSKEFIAERLFQPFDSTKGVSGMGVGVFQSREFFRSINGDLSVVSSPGEGTTFTMTIPVKHD